MTRNLKALGLTVLAVLALSAAATSVASAEEFAIESEAQETTLSGKQDGEQKDVFTTTAGTMECSKTTYSATMTQYIALTVEVTPTYSECTFSGVAGGAFEMNGCKYRIYTGTVESSKNEGSLDIVCPAGKEIKVTAKLFGTTKCTIDIPAQTGLKTVTFTNIGSGATREVTVEVNIEKKIKYIHTAGTGFGSCSGGTPSETGSYSGAFTLTGEDAAKAHAGLVAAALANPEITPNPLKIPGANEQRTGGLYFSSAGDYEVVEQFLETGTKFKMVKTAKESCPGVVNVTAKQVGACLFTVKTEGASSKESDTLVTKWNFVGGGVVTIKSTVERP